MKILIVSLPRTGSSSLLNKIANEENLIRISEPFDMTRKKIIEKEFPENCVVKSIIKQHPIDVVDIVSFYVDLSKKFDKIILLSRKDLKSCWESLSFFTYYENTGFKSNMEYFWEETPHLKYSKNYVIECDELIKKLSMKLKIDIIYYEDIFDLNSKDRLRKGDKKNIKSNLI
jgi:hypothetical protein